METNYKSFYKDLSKLKNTDTSNLTNLTYLEAFKLVRDSKVIDDYITSDIQETQRKIDNNENLHKTKKDLRYILKKYSEIVLEVTLDLKINVQGLNTTEFVNMATQELVGFDIISDLYFDDLVTDIYFLSWDKIYYEKKGEPKPLKFSKTFRDSHHYNLFVERLIRTSDSKPLDNGENKILDFDLYEDRYNAISQIIAPNSTSLTMRKHSENHIQLDFLIENNCLDETLANFIGTTILGECNIMVAGVTGSGKTTTMRALTDHYIARSNKRLLVCEDTREIFPKNDHTLELQTYTGRTQENTVDLRKLILTALRQKPKYLLVGEIRGLECEACVEAMATGHSTITSIHAGTAIDVINRLILKYQICMPNLSGELVERIIGSALDYILIQDDIPNIGRRITSVTECMYDYINKTIKLTEICLYNFDTDKFDFINKISNEKFIKMRRKGISADDLKNFIKI